MVDPPTTSGRTRREVLQTLKDAKEFIGYPKTNKREHRQLDNYQALMAQVVEPSNYEGATQYQVWVDVMVEEYNSIMINDFWEVVSRLEDRSIVGSHWICMIKYDVDGNVEKYKARFVEKGYVQKEGIDYDETFFQLTRYTYIQSVISLATQMGWKIPQMDAKTTFLNKVIDEEVYIEQPEGFETHERGTHVCKLKKALYRLKQTPRAWYGQIDNYL